MGRGLCLFVVASYLMQFPAWGREWTSGNGKFTIEADFVALKDGKVVLEKPDGGYLSVPLEKLSRKDQEYVAELTGTPLDDTGDEAGEDDGEPVAPRRGPPVIKLKGSKPNDPPGEVRKFPKLSWDTHCLAFSPNGAFLAAGKLDNKVFVFDVDRGTQVFESERLDELGQVQSCIFTPNGKQLLTAGYRGLIKVWDVASNGLPTARGQFAGHTEEVLALAVSPDGKYAASGGRDKRVRYWQISNGKELAMFTGFEGSVRACQFSPDGRSILATDLGTLVQFQIKNEKTSSTTLTRSWASGQFAAFSQDARWVAAGDGYTVRVWDLKTNKELPKLEAGELQWSGVFTPDGTRLITGGDGKANVFDLKSGKRLAAVVIEKGFNIKALAASRDNQHIATSNGSSQCILQVFRIPRD